MRIGSLGHMGSCHAVISERLLHYSATMQNLHIIVNSYFINCKKPRMLCHLFIYTAVVKETGGNSLCHYHTVYGHYLTATWNFRKSVFFLYYSVYDLMLCINWSRHLKCQNENWLLCLFLLFYDIHFSNDLASSSLEETWSALPILGSDLVLGVSCSLVRKI